MVQHRLHDLRALLSKHHVDAYIIPSTDPHQSEYVPACWQRRHYLSGFTGSAGDLVVTASKAALWTDSRYFIQAAQELKGSGISLMKQGLPKTPSMACWLLEHLPAGARVGLDPALFTKEQAGSLGAELAKGGVQVRSIETNLVDEIWADQPSLPMGEVVLFPERYAGKGRDTKLALVREEMLKGGHTHHVVTLLDAIAWVLNIRSTDVEFNPVCIAYLVIEQQRATLFVSLQKISDSLRAALAPDIEVSPYSLFSKALQRIPKGASVLLDRESVSQMVVDHLPEGVAPHYGQSPITLMKAVKNETEIEGMHRAHLKDGVAMVSFLSWLEKALQEEEVTEFTAQEKLRRYRAAQEGFRDLSFETISAFGPHGAIVHYSVTPESDVPLGPRGLYLLDSGGQYLDGTTDITRTLVVGEPTQEERRAYTLVLKGHLALSGSRFPEGTVGKQLDTIARKPLWDVGLNYAHGTGHGVGSYLNVHEGPQAISYYRCIGVPFQVGMVTSNEPGYYKEGDFGVRIENLIYVVPDEQDGFLRFEEFTLCPYERRLIDLTLLSPPEIAQIDRYHTRCLERLSPHLQGAALSWLAQATAPLGEYLPPQGAPCEGAP